MRIVALLTTLVAFGAQAQTQEKPAAQPQEKPAAAQEKPAAAAHEMPEPSEELKVERWFVGSWTCKGHVQAGPMGPEHQMASRLVFKMELGGFWLHYTGTALAGPMKGKETLIGMAGWVGDHHERYDFHPGGYWHFTSKGWEADVLTFEGDAMMGAKKSSARHVMTRKGKDRFDGVILLDGKTQVEESCTRATKG